VRPGKRLFCAYEHRATGARPRELAIAEKWK
jgi:hypothetical protein